MIASSGGSENAIDPEVWRRVVRTSRDRELILFAGDLNLAAREATDSKSKDILEVLGMAASPMLRPDNWNEPFVPAATWRDGRRSVIPSDLNDDQQEILLSIARSLDGSDLYTLRARVYDICWTYIDRKASTMLSSAIDAYMSAPLEADVWHAEGKDCWWRASELARRGGELTRGQVELMASAVVSRIREATLEDRFFAVQLSQFARGQRMITGGDRQELADLAFELARQALENRDWRLSRAWEREGINWSQRGEASFNASLRIGQCYAAEAEDRRQGVGGEANSASHFTERAIATLRELPRAFRAAKGVEELITCLREQLDADRTELLGSMLPVYGDEIEVSEWVQKSRELASGHSAFGALVRLVSLCPLMDVSTSIEAANRAIREYPLASLLGRVTYRSSGQKVAATPGMDLGSTDSELDPTVWSAMVENQLLRADLQVMAVIEPALEVITSEHRYGLDWLHQLCRSSPAVPTGHEHLWARGLQHGLNGDSASAVCMLVPQIEHWVRMRLKANGAVTVVIGEHGVETEKGMSALLEDRHADEAIGSSLVFELKSMFTEQSGPNLRNDIAHGLANDAALDSPRALYSWWLALWIVVMPMAQIIASQQATLAEQQNLGDSPDGENDPVT